MRTALFIVALLASSTASAILPDNGWYWNPSESGRGFNIEIQNNVLFMAGFVYDQAGNQLWAVTGGPMSSDRFYSGTAYVTSGGQCVGCAYRPPQNTAIGNVTVSFTDTTHATVTVNGVAMSLQREQFGIDFTNPATPTLGDWAITVGSPVLPAYFGERIALASTTVTAQLGLTAVGSRSGDSSRIAVASYSAGLGKYAILLDSSTSYYDFYVFSFTGFNLIEGDDYTYLKGSSPTGSLPFVAHRVKSAALVAGANAPGILKLSVGDDADAQAARRKAAAATVVAPPAVQEMAAMLERQLAN